MTEDLNKLDTTTPVVANDFNSLGLMYASRQNHGEAIRAFRKASSLDSGCAEAFYNQALSLTALGRMDEAIDNYTKAVRLRPDFQEAYYNLGNLLKKMGFLERAVEIYRLSITLKPDSPEAFNNLGLCFKALKRFEEAVESCQKAIELKPDYAEAYNNLGLVLQDQGLWEEAIEKFESAITLKPHHSAAHYNLGFALNEIGQLDAAESYYRQSIQLDPEFADAHNNLGALLKTRGRIEEAILYYRKALEYSSDKAEIYNNLGNALKRCGRIDEALVMLQRALAQKPDYAEAYNNMGVALQTRGNYAAARKNYEKAFELKPDFAEARFNRATLDLMLGNFTRGWQGYEWRFKKKQWQDVYPLRHNLPRWDGSAFQGKRLFVYDEQGFGDTIQFVRYLPMVRALGGSVILGTRKPLLACLQGVEGVDEVIDRSDVGDPSEGCDLAVSLLSLPGIFGTDLENIPAQIPYLHAQVTKISDWKKRIRGAKFKVGLVWAGNPDHENDHIRSVPLRDLIAMAKIPGSQLFSLQTGAAAGQIMELPADTDLIDLGCDLKDFSDTAAAMVNLDLVISVDTAAAHLAGALGLPVWTLVYYAPDWRWMLDRDDSPWYPTMRLFRQQSAGDWSGAVNHIITELKDRIQRRELARGPNQDTGFEIGDGNCPSARCVKAKDPCDIDLPGGCGDALTLHQQGVAAYRDGSYQEARTLISRAVALDSQNPLYQYNLGRVWAVLGDLHAAIKAYQRAIHLKPDYIEAYVSLGAALKDQMRLDEALNLFDQVLKVVPAEPRIHHGRGQVLIARGQYAKAIEAFERAIHLNPESAVFYNSFGIAQGLSGNHSAAVEAFEQALALQPDLAEAVNNLGTAMQEEGEFDRATNYFSRAIQIKPDYGEARFNRAAIHLLKGNFAQGWTDYEGRSQQAAWKRNHSCPETVPRWDGTPFYSKRLCVHSEQGLGDTLQFVRYLPRVKARGGTVILEVNELLFELVKGINGVDELVVQGSPNSTAPGHDICVHLLSLPGIFKTDLENIPANIPYLVTDPSKVSYWRKKLAGRDFKVGLVWAGNPSHKKNRYRSIGLEGFQALAEIPGIRLYGLQKGDAALQVEKMAGIMDICNLGDELYDFSDTAALIEVLDLVVTVDTAVAHLAGSLGKQTWVLLPFVPDWRWMLDRDDSPWYPTLRLFRQPQKGNWGVVLSRIAAELEILISS